MDTLFLVANSWRIKQTMLFRRHFAARFFRHYIRAISLMTVTHMHYIKEMATIWKSSSLTAESNSLL